VSTQAAVVEAPGEPFTLTEVHLDEPHTGEVVGRGGILGERSE
jgi:Zn-dependent alcohol dehydrogenase